VDAHEAAEQLAAFLNLLEADGFGISTQGCSIVVCDGEPSVPGVREVRIQAGRANGEPWALGT